MATIARIALRPLRELTRRSENLRSLEPACDALSRAVERAAPDGSRVNAALSGTDLGHPLHPLLTDLVIGAWTSALVLDWFGAESRRLAADRLVAVGFLSAVPTAAAGLNDWATLAGPTRRLGLVHATTNIVATGMFGASWLARRAGRRSVGRSLALAAYGTISLGAYFGGHLTFSRGAGVDHTAFLEGPDEWTVVADETSVQESTPVLVHASGIEVLLVRDRGSVYALLDRCAHQGGPLHAGVVDDGCVVCPWHASMYRLRDGVALSGPTAHPQRTLQVRIRDAKIEVRK